MGKVAEAFKAARDVLKADTSDKAAKEKAFVEFVKRAAMDKEVTCFIVCDSIADLNICYPSDIVQDVNDYYLSIPGRNDDAADPVRYDFTFEDLLEEIKLHVWNKDESEKDIWISSRRVKGTDKIFWIRVDNEFRNLGIYWGIVSNLRHAEHPHFDPLQSYPVAHIEFIRYMDPDTKNEYVKEVEIKRLDNTAPFGMSFCNMEGFDKSIRADVKADLGEVLWSNVLSDQSCSYMKSFISEIISCVKSRLINGIKSYL